MGKRVPPQLMPLVRAVTAKIGHRVDVYYKRRQGRQSLVFGGIKDGIVVEHYQRLTPRKVEYWTADVLDFIDRAKNHPARQQRFEA